MTSRKIWFPRKNLNSRENVTSREMWLARKFYFLENVTPWEMWHLDFRVSQIFGFCWDMRLPGICDFSGESWLLWKCYFLDNVTSLEISKYDNNYTWVKILTNNHMKHSCRRYIRTFPSSYLKSWGKALDKHEVDFLLFIFCGWPHARKNNHVCC